MPHFVTFTYSKIESLLEWTVKYESKAKKEESNQPKAPEKTEISEANPTKLPKSPENTEVPEANPQTESGD